ncbi:Uncharacterised protein [uncultured archaeon]|nr:Uncharacterised protein [uncultured archaeon]
MMVSGLICPALSAASIMDTLNHTWLHYDNCPVISIFEFQLWFKTKPGLNMYLNGLFQLSYY